MTVKEAVAQGLRYTGISWPTYDKNRAAKAKERVEARKKKYKCRAVIVKDSNNWSSYYGDENFLLVQYDTVETLQDRLDTMPTQFDLLKSAYEKDYNELLERQKDLENKLEKIKSLIK